MGLLSPLTQSFLKTPAHSCSEDGHLLAHLGVPHRTHIQTGIPAQGAHNLNETQHIHTGHKHREEASSRDTEGEGSPGLGHTACLSAALLADLVGEGEESGM